MKKLKFLGIMCLTLLTFGTTFGQADSKEIAISSFDKVSLYVAADVFISKGPNTTMRVEGRSEDIANLKVTNKENKLLIGKDNNFKSTRSLKIYISTPELIAISLAGSGNITSDDIFTGSEFEANVSGSGNIYCNVDVKTFEASISGSGNISVAGKAVSVEMSTTGSGNILASLLKSNTGEVSIMGSGNCEVNVSDELEVSIMGSGNVTYTGEPNLEVSKTGSGRVASKN